ncbi:MAG: hypothetical protein Q7K33_01145 [Candidatus Berkelbacteria bacterium]|nr:hypothetical protein [Candidatus Berkelbacteria bacterium]
MGVHLVVVPTSGNVRTFNFTDDECEEWQIDLEPGNACKSRLAIAVKILKSDPDARLAISGGARRDASRSEAVVAKRWFCIKFSDLVDRILIVDAKSNFTAGDMAFLAECINGLWPSQRPSKITIVSHPLHAEMASTYLGRELTTYFEISIPIKRADSEEPLPYKRLQLMAHRFANRFDPEWRHLPSWPLRVAANLRYN